MMYFGDKAVGIATHDNSILNINDSNNKIINLKKLNNTTTGDISRLFAHNEAKVLYITGFTSINSAYMFEFMYNLEAAIFTDATSIVNYVFWGEVKHTLPVGIDFYKQVTFPGGCPFCLGQKNVDIILRASEMSTTQFTTSTWGIPPKMKFYVPSSLVNTYLADSNWSTFGSERILPIEGTKYEDINWWKSIV